MSEETKSVDIQLGVLESYPLDIVDAKGFTIVTPKGSKTVNDLLPRYESLNNFCEPLLNYNGNYDTKANKFTPDAKRKYIIADKSYYQKTKSNMIITSGRRSVAEQARLFILHTWHNQGNPAAWPGCSFHNWGLAADMVRTDESNVIDSMNDGGWTKTVGGEGWHFECTASSDHAKAAKKIQEFKKSRTGLAYKWSEHIANFYIKTKDYNKRAPFFNNRLEQHKKNEQILQGEINQFNAAVTAFKKRIAQYNNDVHHYNTELEKAKRLVNEINSMPDGPERRRKIQLFRKIEAWLNQESNRLNNESASIDSENNRLSAESVRLDTKIQSYKNESAWLDKEYKDLTKIESEIHKHEVNANSLLSQIESAVS